jgi:UDP-N-acetylmuramate dehydrogenase
MLTIKENFPLKRYNTMGINVNARYFARTESLEEIKEVLINHREYFPFYIIGGGSNILFTKNYNGLILQPDIKGIRIIENDGTHCIVEVGAGENWDDFVQWSVDNGLGGLENLSLIPGSVGSSPIQNIGAYGVEVKDVIDKVNYLDLETLDMVSILNSECHFEYRDSIFKNHLKNRFIIISVVFRLKHHHVFNTSYGNLQEEIEKTGEISLKTIRNAVIHIRRSKLPDPEDIGNSGSFFKNPVIDHLKAEEIKRRYNAMPSFPVNGSLVKIPAGWLIEKCGWKGKRIGNAGIHENQALVIVNYGNATGQEIKNLAMQVSESVYSEFQIRLEPEVNII